MADQVAGDVVAAHGHLEIIENRDTQRPLADGSKTFHRLLPDLVPGQDRVVADAGKVQRRRIGSWGQRVLHAVREQGIERAAPVGNDLRVLCVPRCRGAFGPGVSARGLRSCAGIRRGRRPHRSSAAGWLSRRSSHRRAGRGPPLRPLPAVRGRNASRTLRPRGHPRTSRPAVASPGAARTPAPLRRVLLRSHSVRG